MVTIKDVAKLAGVSMMTVSRAFNENAVIKPSTRKEILDIAESIGYIPNYNARGLATNQKFVIGIFFSSLGDGTSHSFLSSIISATSEAMPDNYLLSVNDIHRITNVDALVQNRMDGVLVVSQSNRDNDFIYQVKALGLPLVVINRPIDDAEIVNVYGDDSQGVELAMDYLAKLGHQRVGIIEGIPGFTSSIERRRGFDVGATRNHLTVVKEAIEVGDYSSTCGQKAMEKILALPVDIRPTAVFCANDDTAIGALSACYAAGVRVPEEISIVGFDDSYYASMSVPALTTVKKPMVKMADLGIQKLFRLIKDNNEEEHKIKVDSELIIRESVKNLQDEKNRNNQTKR